MSYLARHHVCSVEMLPTGVPHSAPTAVERVNSNCVVGDPKPDAVADWRRIEMTRAVVPPAPFSARITGPHAPTLVICENVLKELLMYAWLSPIIGRPIAGSMYAPKSYSITFVLRDLALHNPVTNESNSDMRSARDLVSYVD